MLRYLKASRGKAKVDRSVNQVPGTFCIIYRVSTFTHEICNFLTVVKHRDETGNLCCTVDIFCNVCRVHFLFLYLDDDRIFSVSFYAAVRVHRLRMHFASNETFYWRLLKACISDTRCLDDDRHMRDIPSMLRHSLRSLDTWERKCLSTSARQFSAIFNQYVQYHQWLRNSKMDILVYQSRYSHAYWIILRFIM